MVGRALARQILNLVWTCLCSSDFTSRFTSPITPRFSFLVSRKNLSMPQHKADATT